MLDLDEILNGAYYIVQNLFNVFGQSMWTNTYNGTFTFSNEAEIIILTLKVLKT